VGSGDCWPISEFLIWAGLPPLQKYKKKEIKEKANDLGGQVVAVLGLLAIFVSFFSVWF
jgi:hypothetical protein